MPSSASMIDSHQHVFWWGRDDAGLVADMDDHGIQTAWLLTWEIPPHEDDPAYHRYLDPRHIRGDGTHGGIPLSDLVKARDRYPERFILGYCPYPLWGNAADLLRAAASVHGVRVCGEWKFRIPFDDPRCIELFRAAGQLGMPVVLHLGPAFLPDENRKPLYQKQWYGGSLDNLERALQACPDTLFVGHAPGFWREISGDADREPLKQGNAPVVEGGRVQRFFETYSNLYADLSAVSGLNALQRDPGYARSFLIEFADRLLFGRDQYGGELLGFLQSLDLPQEAMANICSGNARKLVSG